MKKIISILMIIIFMFTCMQGCVYGESIYVSSTIKPDDIISQADSFISAGENSTVATPIDGQKLEDASSTIYNILLGIAIVVAVCIGAYLGVKFMLASAMDKAKYKEALLPYVLGCFVAFGAFAIWKIIVTMLGNL